MLCILIVKQMADFQNKLSELEKRQSELVAENASLKDLCQYLNEQRELREQPLPPCIAGAAISRDSGDGSSASSPSVDKPVVTVHERATFLTPDDAQLKPQQFAKGIFISPNVV